MAQVVIRYEGLKRKCYIKLATFLALSVGALAVSIMWKRVQLKEGQGDLPQNAQMRGGCLQNNVHTCGLEHLTHKSVVSVPTANPPFLHP